MEVDELIKYIKAIPYIPHWLINEEYKSKCPCGGTLTSMRLSKKGHLFVKCNKCSFSLRE